MRMGQGVRTGLGHGGITCVLQTQFSSLSTAFFPFNVLIESSLLLNPDDFHPISPFSIVFLYFLLYPFLHSAL